MFLKIAISSVYPLWLSFFCILFGLGIAWFMYKKSRALSELSRLQRSILFFLRAAYLSILSFLLISPFILSLDPVVEKPLLIFGQDKSMSIGYLSDSANLSTYIAERDDFLNGLRDDFDIHTFDFGSEVKDMKESMDFNHKSTDLSAFFREMRDRFENRNVALMMLASDGLYNRGQNPIYSSSPMAFPVYALGLGDTTNSSDAWINDVHHNKLAFVGNTFDLNVVLEASLLKDKRMNVQIRKNGLLLSEKSLNVNKNDFLGELNFEISAEVVGLQRYEIRVLPMEGEKSTVNNSRYIYVEVLEGQQKILLLSASPHPDIAALKLAINASKNFKAESFLLDRFHGKLENYDLIILHQLPSILNGRGSIGREVKDLPILYILGKGSRIPAFNSLDEALRFENFKRQFNEATPLYNVDFQYFAMPPDFAEKIENFPPLISPFASYETDPNHALLLSQKIGKVETPYPLLSFSENGNRKTGFICGEGLWRWRLFDRRLNGSTQLFDELMQKVVRYLSLKEDRSRFRIEIEPSYVENDDIVVRAEFYDRTFTLNNDYKAELSLLDYEGNEFEYEFIQFGDQYQADLGNLPGGDYRWKATLNDGSVDFIKRGVFNIKELQLEQSSLRADHSFLHNLASREGGRLLYPSELEVFAQDILAEEKYKPILHYTEKMKEIISFAWLFVILLILLASEWFLRKWLGLN